MKKSKFNFYVEMFTRMFDFKGKSKQQNFWYAVLFNALFSLLSMCLALPFIFDYRVFMNVAVAVTNLYDIVVFIPLLSLTVRRLHDVGYSAWSLLWLLLPVAGVVILIVFLSLPSNENGSSHNANQSHIQLVSLAENNFEENSNQNNEGVSQIQDEEKKQENVTQNDNTNNVANEVKVKNEVITKSNDINKNNENINNSNESKKVTSQSVQKQIKPKKTDLDNTKLEEMQINSLEDFDEKFSAFHTRSECISKLQELNENGIITDEEYHKKVLEILKR